MTLGPASGQLYFVESACRELSSEGPRSSSSKIELSLEEDSSVGVAVPWLLYILSLWKERSLIRFRVDA